MSKTGRVTFALLLGVCLADPALAAGCATPADASALKTAAMQQELMVAAFQCHEADAYNRFVTAYRGELQSSDAALKAFFIRRGGENGEAGYDTFKTKAANLSALEQARHGSAFCADTHALFTAALNNPGSLTSFVESRSSAINTADICVESRPILAEVDAEPRTRHAMAAAPQASVRVAQASENAVGGVPAYSAPAMPYWRTALSSARSAQGPDDMARNEDADDARAAYADDDNPPPRPYGPPPGWQPQGWRSYPPPRWYARDGQW